MTIKKALLSKAFFSLERKVITSDWFQFRFLCSFGFFRGCFSRSCRFFFFLAVYINGEIPSVVVSMFHFCYFECNVEGVVVFVGKILKIFQFAGNFYDFHSSDLFSFSDEVFNEVFHDNKFLELKLYAENQWSLGGAVKEELEYGAKRGYAEKILE